MKDLLFKDPTKLCEFTALAGKAYLNDWPDKDEWKVLKYFADTRVGSFCWAGFDGERIVITFRGTEPKTLADWATNLNGVSRSCEALLGENVHGGFLRAYLSLHTHVLGFVSENCKDKSIPIFLVGHSMGGALAEICAAYLGETENAVYTYTVGAPPIYRRRARKVWERMYAKNAIRVVYKNDMVPLLSNVTHLHHGSPLVYMDQRGNIYDNKGGLSGWFGRLWYRLRTINFRFTAVFRDHSWQKYLAVSCGAGDFAGVEKEIGVE